MSKSLTATEEQEMNRKRLEPIPPGEILLEGFMKSLLLSINRLARDIEVPPNRISAIIRGKRAITADGAFRLVRFAGSPGNASWLQS